MRIESVSNRRIRCWPILCLAAAFLIPPLAAPAQTGVYAGRHSSGVYIPRNTRVLNARQAGHTVSLRPGNAVAYRNVHIRLVRFFAPPGPRPKGRAGESAQFVVRMLTGGGSNTLTLRRWQSYIWGGVRIEPVDFRSSRVRTTIAAVRR
jgi:hypothetical protein